MFSVHQAAIHSITRANIPQIKQFIHQFFGSEGDWYEHWVERWGDDRVPVVLMAEWQEDLIGVGIVYHNNFHPHWVDLVVGVHSEFCRQGLGRQLCEALVQASPLQPHHFGTTIAYYQGNEAAERFLFALGYQHRLDCHCLELDIQALDFSHNSELQSGLSIVSFADLFAIPTMQQQVSDFLAHRYAEEHFWSPPQPLDHPAWEGVPLKGVMPELSFALLMNDRVVGAVTAGIRGNDTLDIIWSSISRDYFNPVAVSLLKSLYAHQFRAGYNLDLSKADIEVDTTDIVLSALLDWFPVSEDRVWRILQKPRTSSTAFVAD